MTKEFSTIKPTKLNTTTATLIAATLSLILCISEEAHAQRELALVMIDASGSMDQPVETGRSRWDVAIERAINFVNTGHDDRLFEIWTFEGNHSNPTYIQHYTFDESETLVPSARSAPAAAAIASLSTPALTNWTPLAATYCDAVDRLVSYDTVSPPWALTRRIYLVSDGEENSSAEWSPLHPCRGQGSAAWGGSSTVYNAANPARGGLEPLSWEWKILNKAITGDPMSTANPPVDFQIITDVTTVFDDFIGLAAMGASTSTPGVDGVPTGGAAPRRASTSYSVPSIPAWVTFLDGLAYETGGRSVHIQTGQPLPVFADVNGDRCVDNSDMVIVQNYWNQSVSNLFMDNADINRDSWVNIYDYLALLQHWGNGC